METSINGIHHITVMASDPQNNFDFYTKIMGLRFIKKTVNFDAPGVYHFYFADEIGTPGTVLTFFPFPNARRGSRGTGEATIVSFSIPKGSLSFWSKRLSEKGINFQGPSEKFGYNYITFLDPDGMKLELVEENVENLLGWETNEIPRKYSIRKFFGTTLYVQNSENTEELIRDIFGFNFENETGKIKRYISGEGYNAARIDIHTNENGQRGVLSAGSVHHIAWRTENDKSQKSWMEILSDNGYHTTPVIDRNYFHSIYFREPGGVLFEIATDNPGFLIDEDKNPLGESLKLPEMYEARRTEIENNLIPINHGLQEIKS